MSKNFLYLRQWLTGETYSPACPPRPVILECIPSRSGLSMSVYDREELLYRINGTNGTDRYGRALARFLETAFESELSEAQNRIPARAFCGDSLYLDGERGVPVMAQVAEAIGLSVQVHETRSSTLLIIQKKG